MNNGSSHFLGSMIFFGLIISQWIAAVPPAAYKDELPGIFKISVGIWVVITGTLWFSTAEPKGKPKDS